MPLKFSVIIMLQFKPFSYRSYEIKRYLVTLIYFPVTLNNMLLKSPTHILRFIMKNFEKECNLCGNILGLQLLK